MYTVNPKLQELNIPGIRKLEGGDPLSDPILKKLKAENKLSKLEKDGFIVKKNIEEKKENIKNIDKEVSKK